MAKRVAFQMDPITGVNIDTDSSFRLAEEAQIQDWEVFVYTPDDLMWTGSQAKAWVRKATIQRDPSSPAILGETKLVSLDWFDVIWLRQDPPFDMSYITTTHILDLVRPQTLVVNNPFWVRNFPEKLLVLQYPDLTPPTRITRRLEDLRQAAEEFGDMIVKPLYGNGGAGVFRIDNNTSNLSSLHELFSNLNREPLIAQKFLPAVQNGDKRIILVDGEPMGAINRVPAAGEIRSNLHVGGEAVPATITERDREICERIGPLLKDRGQIFVGIDVIGDYLTEINLTSPTGIQEIERFDKVNLAGKIWAAIDRRRAGNA